MSDKSQSTAGSELRLVKLYMELTGANESAARNVFMHLRESGEAGTSEKPATDGAPEAR